MADFPEQFLFGTATSAYQIEGAWNADGKGESIWDRFSHTPGLVTGGTTADISADHYHRFEDDLNLMKAVGLNAYRFSIAWSRILPAGTGAINRAGLDHYSRVVDACLARDIEPLPCLYHWDLPQALQDRGGWVSRESVEWFKNYAAITIAHLKDRVSNWTIFNEPSIFTGLGYLVGMHAPAIKDPGAYGAALHHACLTTAETVRLIHDIDPKLKAGTALALNDVVPSSDRPEDIAAAQMTHTLMAQSMVDPILYGTYPEAVRSMVEPFILAGDSERLIEKLDFLGINYYTFMRIGEPSEEDSKVGGTAGGGVGWKGHEAGTRVTDIGWAIYPEGMYAIIKKMSGLFGGIPIYITENGGAFNDIVQEGRRHDPGRIELIHDYLAEVKRALNDGYDVRGYMCWTLLDDFEWNFGYEQCFGLVHIDRQTLQRTPRTSYHWYGEVARTRTLISPQAT